MGFFSGRLSYLRFKVTGPAPGMFGMEHLERLEKNRIGARVAAADGIEAGWSGGEHILDTKFDLAKNVVNDTLQFALRIDANKIPSDLMRYAAIELQALAAINPSGRPSNRQRREAKETAKQRVEDEAKDGRFLRRKAYPVLWDAQSNELLVGTTSLTIVDRLHQLFEQTFGQKFELLTSGVLSYRLAEGRNQTRGIEDSSPSAFIPGTSASDVSWIMDDMSKDFLGNEFLLWLWWYLENEDDTLKLSDGSEATVMMSSTLAAECPRGQTGRESITHEGPTRSPRRARAIQSGKLPRKAGLTIVRHDAQYDLTLAAENLAISGAKMPAPEASEERARLEERVTQIRHLIETIDLMIEAFGIKRASDNWVKELGRMQKWLVREETPGRMTG